MQLIINHKPAALKQGSSFEYISENRLFTESDDYTLSITLPLAGCSQNLAIFGHINRIDVTERQMIFDAELHAPGFHKYGTVVVVEVTTSELKVQFLEGRSEQNFLKSLDAIYINEINLGYPLHLPSDHTPAQAWQPGTDLSPVALPWINSGTVSKDNLTIQNSVDYTPPASASQPGGSYAWSKDTEKLSFQPYLLPLTRTICQIVGYRVDLSQWEASEELRYLLVCNTLPQSWDLTDFGHALPHWTVEEYLQKLGLLLGGEFEIDHRALFIRLILDSSRYPNLPVQHITRVLEEVTKELTSPDKEEESSYRGLKNRAYKDCDYDVWKYYCCPWFIEDYNDIVRFKTMTELVNATSHFANWRQDSRTTYSINSLFYAEDLNAYFIVVPKSRVGHVEPYRDGLRVVWDYRCELRPLNLLGPLLINSDEDADTDELDFVPVCIDDTDEEHGRCMFLSFGDYSEDDGQSVTNQETGEVSRTEFFTPLSVKTLNIGERNKTVEYYDRIYIAWWDGSVLREGLLPHPLVENIEVNPDFSGYQHFHFSLRLTGVQRIGGTRLASINPRKKVTVKFLSDHIPNVRAPFLIRGKRYLCAKITATFTETGMSEMLKGEFYPVTD